MTQPELLQERTESPAAGGSSAAARIRLMILNYLNMGDSVDLVSLMGQTGLRWGSLSAHLAQLEEAGLVALEEGAAHGQPYTAARLTASGRRASAEYRRGLRHTLEALPD